MKITEKGPGDLITCGETGHPNDPRQPLPEDTMACEMCLEVKPEKLFKGLCIRCFVKVYNEEL